MEIVVGSAIGGIGLGVVEVIIERSIRECVCKTMIQYEIIKVTEVEMIVKPGDLME